MTRAQKHIILGVHFGHDAGAALIVDGRIEADVSEERFNRVKHSGDLPLQSVAYCLETAACGIDEVGEIAVAGLSKTAESFETLFGLKPPAPTHPRAVQEELNLRRMLRRLVSKSRIAPSGKVPLYARQFFLKRLPKVTFVEHHLAHAACAYYTSNDKRKMLIATVDGIGDGFSSCIWRGENGVITPLVKYGFEASIGWFYSNVTEALGWWHGDGEGKTMGLAPYGDFNKCKGALEDFYPKFKDGSLAKPHRFGAPFAYYQSGAAHWHSDESSALSALVEKYGHKNIAAEAQRILEEQMTAFVLPWLKKENTGILATSGGVFLNVKLNQRIWMSAKVATHYPYPNPGDSGLAVGAALFAAASAGALAADVKRHLYWGPEYSNEAIEDILKRRGIRYRHSSDVSLEAAKYLSENKIVGWFQGRMEAGPRALGNRSILMSPKKQENKDIINARVKFREAFRPFCPSLLDEAKADYLVKPRSEPFMVTSFDCLPERRSEIPAVVHVDGTLRPQTVTREDNPRYFALIKEFGRLSGTPVVLDTSMNIRGEPMICSPREALRCFYDSGIDVLCLGDFIVEKALPPVH